MKKSQCLLMLIGSIFLLNACGSGHGGQPILLATEAPPAGQVGVAYPRFTFKVASGGRAPFQWSEAGGLPPGLFLSEGGELSGTPTRVGSFPIKITAMDSSFPSLTASQKLTIVIDKSFFPAPLKITSGSPPVGSPGSEYGGSPNDFSLTASGGIPPYVWTWAAGSGSSLPPGLSLSASGGSSGAILGVPTADGDYTVVITVLDSDSPLSSVSRMYSITISTPTALAIIPRSSVSVLDSATSGLACVQHIKPCSIFPAIHLLPSKVLGVLAIRAGDPPYNSGCRCFPCLGSGFSSSTGARKLAHTRRAGLG
jgi:hypothetical protein